jgi:cyclopropane fatty-acyl-phospholipid synthase-like methyltransferase
MTSTDTTNTLHPDRLPTQSAWAVDAHVKMAPRFAIRGARVVSRVPEILRICAGRRVLHLGCSDMPYTLQRGDQLVHKQLARVTRPDDLWGIDISAEGVHLLRQMGFENTICGNVEELVAPRDWPRFDVIVAGEIIEHLNNPGLFLQSVRDLMTIGTELVITTVNATAIRGALYACLRKERVNPDHNYYFSYRTLTQLLNKHGLECREICYYQDVTGRGWTKLAERLVWASTRVTPMWSDGLVVRAVLAAA